MNQIIKVNNYDIYVKEFRGQRVATFKDIDLAHERPEGTAGRNFRENRKHFIEGVDFFQRNSSEAKSEFGIIAPNGLTLISEQGYMMLVKSLTDDLAWTVQRELVGSYFRKPNNDAKNSKFQYQEMSPQLQFMINMELEQKRQAKELDEVKENLKTTVQALSKESEKDFRSWVNRALSSIAASENYLFMGSPQERHQAVRTESYNRLTTKRPCRLDQRVAHERGRAVEAGATQEKIKAINKLAIIIDDKDLKPVYESVIREMLVAYCVNIKK